MQDKKWASTITARLKSIIVGFLIFVVTITLSHSIYDFVASQSLFSITWQFSAKVIFLMVLSAYAFALSIGGWNNNEQYILVPVPFGLGVFFTLVLISPTHALLASLVLGTILAYDVHKSSQAKKLLIRFDPKMILRFTARGALFLFTILAALMVYVSSDGTPEINFGQKAAEFVEKPFKQILHRQVPSYALPVITGNVNIKDITEKEVNRVIEPYENFMHHILALLTFLVFHFYAMTAYYIYILTVDLVFWLARKLGLFRVETVMVEQEIIRF
jgi:hypothetical protein